MSCWEKQVVLRMPMKTFGIWFPWEWEQFRDEYDKCFKWEPNHFAPALCTKKQGYLQAQRVP